MAKKKPDQMDLDFEDIQPKVSADPVPVRVVQEQRKNPDIGVIPFEGEARPSRKYRFTYNQQPGTPIEFTKGLLCLSRGTGRRKNEFIDYKIEDGEEVELPEEVAEHLMGLSYFEDGRSRPRCTLIPV